MLEEGDLWGEALVTRLTQAAATGCVCSARLFVHGEKKTLGKEARASCWQGGRHEGILLG